MLVKNFPRSQIQDAFCTLAHDIVIILYKENDQGIKIDKKRSKDTLHFFQ